VNAYVVVCQTVDSVVESLEFELFRQHGQLMSNGYRRTARRLVFSLRQNTSLRHNLVSANKHNLSQLITELRYGRQVNDGGLLVAAATAAESSSEASTSSELVDDS